MGLGVCFGHEQWQHDRKATAFADFALHADFAALQFDDFPGQCQAQSRAFVTA